MRVLRDLGWARRGLTLLWNWQALTQLALPPEVVSIRGFFQIAKAWPEDLPSHQGNTLIVAGLEGCLDVLEPTEVEEWIAQDLKPRIFGFQEEYQGQAGLIFWLPGGRRRIHLAPANGSYHWQCGPPHKGDSLPLGRILWAGAEADVGHILDSQEKNQDYDGPAWIGLHHPRIS